jgi:hypothetical protein
VLINETAVKRLCRGNNRKLKHENRSEWWPFGRGR